MSCGRFGGGGGGGGGMCPFCPPLGPALIALLWRVDHSKGENYHFMTNTDLYFTSYVQLSQ